MTRPIVLSAFLRSGGMQGAGWRRPHTNLDWSMSFDAYRFVAQRLETGGFDALFLNDSLGFDDFDPFILQADTESVRWDPLTLLAGLAVTTKRIGLIATGNTTYNEPFNLARRLCSLDQMSGGRIGWNCVTSLGGGENFGLDAHVSHAERYDRAEEFVDVVKGLWDSWDDDALVRDKRSGAWLDASKYHFLDHAGKHFKVKGPLNAPRPIQGYPVLAQAGSSEPGRNFAARIGELIFTAAQTKAAAASFRRDILDRAAKFGRARESLRVLPGLGVIVAESVAAAQAKFDAFYNVEDSKPLLKGISLYASLGVDLSELPLDEPIILPEQLPETNTHKSRQMLLAGLIRLQRPTVRQLFQRLVAGGHRVLMGTPTMIADDFAEWVESGAADGFNLMFPEPLESVNDFVEMVIPELRRRGMVRHAYEGTTLRDHLGLPRPESRYCLSNAAASALRA